MSVCEAGQRLVAEGEILYLSRRDVLASLQGRWDEAIDAVREAYSAHADGDVMLPKAEYLKYPGRPSYDRIIPLLGYLGGGFKLSGLKQICSAPLNVTRDLPRASGLLILNDPETNRPFCIMEAAEISAVRTAAVTGVALQALDVLEDCWVIALLGCGALAGAHLAMLAHVLGERRPILRVHDPDAAKLEAFAVSAHRLGFEVEPCASPVAAVEQAQIVIPMTTAEEPYLYRESLGSSWLLSSVSLLDAHLDVYEAADLILVDDLRQSLAEGRPLEKLASQGVLPVEKIVEIGHWLAQGRRRDQQRIVFNPMGTVITDLAVGAIVFERALATVAGQRLPI